MPEVIVIDEIGSELECLAARTIAQRGVQLVATAHGNELENVIKNPALADLVRWRCAALGGSGWFIIFFGGGRGGLWGGRGAALQSARPPACLASFVGASAPPAPAAWGVLLAAAALQACLLCSLVRACASVRVAVGVGGGACARECQPARAAAAAAAAEAEAELTGAGQQAGPASEPLSP
jgi:hypothetical protein